jgi:formylmethanofuran dehydrogenase subunit E
VVGKTAVKKEKAKPVLTAKSCAKCGERMMSDKVSTVFTITFVGAKRSSLFVHRHKGCE